MFKRFTRELRIELLGFLGGCVLGGLGKTWRFELHRDQKLDRLLGEDKPFILVFWHNRQLLMPTFRKYLIHPSRNVATLMSNHSDGRIIQRVVAWLGLDSVAGSSSEGGVEGLRNMTRKLKEGTNVGITPDGPKGPVYKAKAGVVKAAQLSGAVLIPGACGADRKWVFGSWDRMILAKPFSRLVGVVGEPIEVPRKISDDELGRYLELLESRLNEITQKADSYEYR